jgi:hypothetical protein
VFTAVFRGQFLEGEGAPMNSLQGNSWFSIYADHYLTSVLVGGFNHFLFSVIYGIILPIE